MTTEPGPQEPIVRMRGLVKHFGDVQALRGIDMDLPRGPVGLLGPNGAGKTTLISLLLGLVEPTAGEASIAGLVPKSRADRIAIRKLVGYMPESDCLLPGMTGVELVSTLARFTGLSKQDAMTRAHEVLDYVELEEARYRPLDGFSTGMKQRLKLAQALVHDPELLLLDEPTNGLDPKGRRHMLSLVEDLGRNQGKNIVLCSHLLPDVEKTCDHVVVVVEGRVALQGAIAELTAADETRIRVEVEDRQDEFAQSLRSAGMVAEPASGDAPERGAPESKGLVVTVPNADDADAICGVAAEGGFQLRAIDPVRSSLEQIFLQAVDGADVSKTGSTPASPAAPAAPTIR